MKIVTKPWGKEIWIADGTQSPYAFKQIEFLASQKSSLQVHKYKHETNYVISGFGEMLIGVEPIDIDIWLYAESQEERAKLLEAYMQETKLMDLRPGVGISVPPGYIHRVFARTHLILVECSTTHLDDVFRLEDETNRGNGKIESEHQS